MITKAEIAKYIDHTILKPDATKAEITQVCDEAKQYGFASVCVNSSNIAHVAKELEGSDVAPCCVVGFPLGAMALGAKAHEAKLAVSLGAKEIDMVMNIGAAKDKNWALVAEDIEDVMLAVNEDTIVKLILETCLLTDDEICMASAIGKTAEVDFIKTSTGFSHRGARAGDIRLIRAEIGPEMGIKASGGIRTYEDAMDMIKAGATRIGASSSVAIVT